MRDERHPGAAAAGYRLGNGGRHAPADLLDRIQVAVEQVLEHDPLDAQPRRAPAAARCPRRACRRSRSRAARRGSARRRRPVPATGPGARRGPPARRGPRRTSQPVISDSGIGSRPARSQAASTAVRSSAHSATVLLTRVVLVGVAGGEADAARAAAAADDQVRARALERLRQDRAVVAPLRPDQLELLLQQLHARADRREGEPVRLVLGLQPAGAEPELHAPARHVVGGDDDLGELGGVAEGGGGDQRAEAGRCSWSPQGR